jgi:hypothetical protein
LQIVDTPDLMAFTDQPVAQMRTDKSRAARDNDFHAFIPVKPCPAALFPSMEPASSLSLKG